MDTSHSFEIQVKKAIPYLTKFFFWTMCLFFALLCFSYFFMTPTKYASNEMSTTYYLLALPDTIKNILGTSIIGTFLFGLLYRLSKLTKRATLLITNKSLVIKDDKTNQVIKCGDLRKIHFNDLTNIFGKSRQKTEIALYQKNNKYTVLRLTNYSDSDNVLQELSKISNVKLTFFDKSIITTD